MLKAYNNMPFGGSLKDKVKRNKYCEGMASVSDGINGFTRNQARGHLDDILVKNLASS